MFVTANGIRIHYELSGRKDDPVVILSHSLASSLKMWEPQMEMLRSHFQVLRYDTPAIIPAEAQPIWDDRIQGVRRKGMESQLEVTMERWFTPSFLSLNPPILTLIKEEFLATPAEGYIGCAGAIRRLNYLSPLSEINLPTFIIVGEDDPATPVSASQAIHEHIKNSNLVILPSTRHLSNVEQPRVFNENLVEFLMNVSTKKEK